MPDRSGFVWERHRCDRDKHADQVRNAVIQNSHKVYRNEGDEKEVRMYACRDKGYELVNVRLFMMLFAVQHIPSGA
jgi:hypothetical protein